MGRLDLANHRDIEHDDVEPWRYSIDKVSTRTTSLPSATWSTTISWSEYGIDVTALPIEVESGAPRATQCHSPALPIDAREASPTRVSSQPFWW
mmetsp:Transcript_109979/g.354704  ORF Transcript_109979/g.354704 Transcript_109979/m.354704 type:complete len:94 (-) Transcript_109979:1440-1721(-)